MSLVIAGREAWLGPDFKVLRVLPHARQRSLGPWLFLDHFGPRATTGPRSEDVRPHPHIGLSTVTWLYEGQSWHRDSLGVSQPVRPRDLNIMTAGAGVVHSERCPEHLRGVRQVVHGLQLWLALPRALEDAPASFQHHDAADLPAFDGPGVRGTVVAGQALGLTSPARLPSPTLFVVADLEAGSTWEVPVADEVGLYVVAGRVRVADELVEGGRLIVLPGPSEVRADGDAQVVVLGGQPIDGPRILWWNFVASTEARLEAARERWVRREFPSIPGDDDEFIPLPA